MKKMINWGVYYVTVFLILSWKNGSFTELSGTEKEIPCELALLSIGFLHPRHKGLLSDLGIELDKKGNVNANWYKTNINGIFTAGDMRRGQSLIVNATISEGREAAREIDLYLTGSSVLDSINHSLINIVD